jgi:hypothetical protein
MARDEEHSTLATLSLLAYFCMGALILGMKLKEWQDRELETRARLTILEAKTRELAPPKLPTVHLTDDGKLVTERKPEYAER